MALEPGVDLVKRVELGDREVTAERQDTVQANRGMALGEDESVAIRPVRTLRINAQDVEIQRGQYVGRGQRTAEVASLGAVDRLDDQAPGLLCGRAQGARVVERDGLHQ